MGSLIGGSPQPATFSQGGNPAAYIPTAQPQADTSYQNIVNSILGMVGPAGQTSPGAAGYAQAQPLVSQLGQIPGNIQNYNTLQGWAIPNFFAGAGAQPAMDMANQGANIGAGYGAQSLPALYGAGTNLIGNMPQTLTQGAADLFALMGPIQQQAFDPQHAIYNQEANLAAQNAAVANAGAGLGASPYGASVTTNALNNFNLDWQRRQLQNMVAGAGAMGNLATQGGNLYGQAGNLYNQGASLLEGLPQFAASAYGLPYSTGATMGSNLLTALNQAIGGQGQLGTSLGNALAGITSAANLGNNQFQIPQQMLNDLQSYLQLGQSGSSLAGQLGTQGFNQAAQGFGGLISGLGGINSLTGGGITNALGFGGGGLGAGLGNAAFAGLPAATQDAVLSSAFDVPAVSTALDAGAGGGAGGTGLLASLLPTGA